MRNGIIVCSVALLALSLASAGAAASPPLLRLHRGVFDARGPHTAAVLARTSVARGPYAIVQLRGPVSEPDQAALRAAGVEVIEYIPDFAFLVRGDPGQIAAAARLPQVYASVPFALADKLAPALIGAINGAGASARNTAVAIHPWPGGSDALRSELQAAGIDPQQPLDPATIRRAAELPSVRWIETASRPRLLNDKAREIIGVDAVWRNRSLFGAGQIIAVADSGLDTGNPATLSPDFAGRIAATHIISQGGDLADGLGHGTHVAGSVAGAGVQSGAVPARQSYAGSFAGVAPEAQLVIQAFEAGSGGEIIGLDPDPYPLFQQAYADGARIHTNSWGDPTGPEDDREAAYGGYPQNARRTDQFVWDHPDMAIFFAAGNSGADGTPDALGLCRDGNGVVDPDSLLAPGTAKNVITVGASENERTTGGLAAAPWLLLNLCFLTLPIAQDTVSNNANGMAAFSSRGPTDDGRFKPDLVAPGTNIVSNRSHAPGALALWGDHETNAHYVYSGGTSMATPLAAGAGALTRQWLIGRGISNPSAAAIKATLLNTTHNMAPGQYGTGSTQEIPTARPNHVTGWGRVDLDFMTAPPPYDLWVDDHTTGMTTGQATSYQHTGPRSLEVTDRSQPLRILLSWTDPPASPSAARQLVNDLDLVVTGPDSTVYRGNNVTEGDRINNVEGIIIENPAPGRYRIDVRAHNVPQGRQPYALAVGGPLRTASNLPPAPSPTPAPDPGATPVTTPSPSHSRIVLPLVLKADRR